MRARYPLAALVTGALVLGNFVADAEGKEPRKDPENRKGISPYMELVVKGNAAFTARDIPGAIGVFQDAIKMKPDEMLAYYRLGEAELEAGKLDDAEKAWEAGLSKRCSQGCGMPDHPDTMKAKLMFVL